MANYQLAHLFMSTRLEVVSVILAPLRPWGLVTELSREYGVSRKFLYELCEKALASVSEAFLPKAPGRKTSSRLVVINESFVQRAIVASLSVVPGTVHTVQLLLGLVLDGQRSTAYISQIAKEIEADALEYTQGQILPILALTEADEIFQGRKPCLTLVDGRFFWF